LLVSVFRCTDVAVLDSIGEALNRKVDVRFLMTPRARVGKRGSKRWARIWRAWAPRYIRIRPGGEVSRQISPGRQWPRLDYSLNLTAKCFAATCDFILLTHDPEVVAGLRELFEVDWLAPHSTLSAHNQSAPDRRPGTGARPFTALLQSASRSIHIIDHKLNDPRFRRC